MSLMATLKTPTEINLTHATQRQRSTKRKRRSKEYATAVRSSKRKLRRSAGSSIPTPQKTLRLPDELIMQVLGFLDDFDDITALRQSCRQLARLGFARMWECPTIRIGHKVAKDSHKRQMYLASDATDALKHVRKLTLRSLSNVTAADMAETLSSIWNNLDARKLQALILTQDTSFRAVEYEMLSTFLARTSNIKILVIPRAHREFREDVQSSDRFCDLSFHIITKGGNNIFVRRNADLELFEKIVRGRDISPESLSLFGTRSNHSILALRYLNTIADRVFDRSVQPLHLRDLNLTDVSMQGLVTMISFPSLETLQLINCYGMLDFMDSVTSLNLLLKKFVCTKYTAFSDTEVKDIASLNNFVRSLKLLQHLCIQLPTHDSIRFPYADGLIPSLSSNIETLSLQIGPTLPTQLFDSLMLKLPKLISLGIASDVMSMAVANTNKKSSQWFASVVKSLAKSYVSSNASPYRLDNLYIVSPQVTEAPRNVTEWMNSWATSIFLAFSSHGVSLKTITLEMRREIEVFPFASTPIMGHYRVTKSGYLKLVRNLSKADLDVVRSFGARIERHLDDHIMNATDWQSFW